MKNSIEEKVTGVLKKLSEMDVEAFAEYDVKEEAEKKYSSAKGWTKKILEYKKAEDGFDADVSLFSIVCYTIAFPYVLDDDTEGGICEHKGLQKVICHNVAQKYEIMYEDNKPQLAYHGDTMNSFQTIFNQINRFHVRENLQNEMEEYAKWVHTVGNFIPVPHLYDGRNSGTFNAVRYAATKDFWDVTLYWIYRWYQEGCNREILGKLVGNNRNNIRACEYWLKRFENWEQFVEKNYLQDFVYNTECNVEKYGMPKEFWEGHLRDGSDIMPDLEEAKQFLRTVPGLIEMRGRRIAREIKSKDEICDQ